uniref:SDR family NAD(P)-dependent oxidoreductase n=1 Tax=Mycobacterium tuberculosis TaxID=1773 RepID=UPI00254E14D9
KAKAYQVDVKLWELVSNGVKQVVKDFGHLDVMIANAGIPATAGLLELTFEEWDNIVQTDYNGVFYCARAAGQIFKEQGHGNLITTASM